MLTLEPDVDSPKEESGTAKRETKQKVNNCIHDGKKTKTLEEMGAQEINDTTLSFQIFGSNSVEISFTKMEMILFRFLSENTEKSHSKANLKTLFDEYDLTPGELGIKDIDEIISSINKKLKEKDLEKACGIKPFHKSYVSHGIETYIRKNGKSIDLNKLKQSISWEDKEVFIKDERLFWLVYNCVRSNENIGGVELSKEDGEKVVSLGLPLRESDKKSNHFLV